MTTPFVGRESELAGLARLIADPQVRLITIHGVGGMGKSRLALEAASYSLDRFPHGVWFVPLAHVTAADGMYAVIAEAVGYPFQRDRRTSRQQIHDFLREKHALLILDNCEHLLPVGGGEVIHALLEAAPQVQIVATSRERLNLSAETVFTVVGMEYAEWERLETAHGYGVVRLFMQSARRVRPDYELREADLPSLARICRLVEGMPLGVLLAAAWIEILSPAEIADEIGQSLDFLTVELRDLPARHRAIRGVFDYSWNLMNGAEAEVMARLSAFRGGFGREAAQMVTGASLQMLMTLVNKSLLAHDHDTGRFSMHELLRQYAEEQLEAAGEAESTRAAHAVYYAGVMHQHEAALKGQTSPDADSVDHAAILAQLCESQHPPRSLSPTTPLIDPLTEREVEVLALVAQGLSNRDIAQQLVISIPTVKTHLNRIFSKLDVKSRTQALIKAKAHGILSA